MDAAETAPAFAPQVPTPAAPAQAPPPLPSIHVRALLTWVAIFPLVAIGMTALAPFSESWHPVLRALVLTVVVVPLAVYVVVPRLLRLHGARSARLRTRAARSAPPRR